MEHPTHPDVLVDGHWLTDHLDDPNVRVIDIHLDPALYEGGHIPGAVHWPALTTLLGPDFRTNFDVGATDTLLGQSGITNETTVVICSDHRALGAWGFWFLKMIGHDRVRVLDGGMEKWRSQARPLTTDVPQLAAVEYRSSEPEHSRRAPLAQVLAAVDDGRSSSSMCALPRSGAGRSSSLRHPRKANAVVTFRVPCTSTTSTR